MTSETTTSRSPHKFPPPITLLPLRAAAEDDERDAGGRAKQRQPAFQVEALMREDSGPDSEDYRHGSDHQRGVAHGGEFQSVELDHELQRNPDEGSDEEKLPVVPGKAGGFEDGQKPRAGEEETVEHEVPHAKPGEGNLAEEESEPPESAGQSASRIAGGVRTGSHQKYSLSANCSCRGEFSRSLLLVRWPKF